MNRKVYYCWLIGLCSLLWLSCNKVQENNNCLSFVNAPVTRVVGPTSAAVNEPITLTVYFGCTDGCGSFNNFDVLQNLTTTAITVVAKYQGCICTQHAPELAIIYTFKKSVAGTYQLKFYQQQPQFITHTIVVN